MLLAAATFEELHDRLPYLNKEVPPHPTPRGNTPEFYMGRIGKTEKIGR